MAYAEMITEFPIVEKRIEERGIFQILKFKEYEGKKREGSIF